MPEPDPAAHDDPDAQVEQLRAEFDELIETVESASEGVTVTTEAPVAAAAGADDAFDASAHADFAAPDEVLAAEAPGDAALDGTSRDDAGARPAVAATSAGVAPVAGDAEADADDDAFDPSEHADFAAPEVVLAAESGADAVGLEPTPEPAAADADAPEAGTAAREPAAHPADAAATIEELDDLLADGEVPGEFYSVEDVLSGREPGDEADEAAVDDALEVEADAFQSPDELLGEAIDPEAEASAVDDELRAAVEATPDAPVEPAAPVGDPADPVAPVIDWAALRVRVMRAARGAPARVKPIAAGASRQARRGCALMNAPVRLLADDNRRLASALVVQFVGVAVVLVLAGLLF